jgi:hypothetical protein
MFATILIVTLILALLGGLPRWPHSPDWGYHSGGGFGLLLVCRCHSGGSRPDLSYGQRPTSASVISRTWRLASKGCTIRDAR